MIVSKVEMQIFKNFLFSHFLFNNTDSSTIGSEMQARSEVQECAITVALLMFGIIVERFIEVLKETLNDGSKSTSPVVILSDENHKNK